MDKHKVMHVIGDAMERNQEGWFFEFEFLANNGAWCQTKSESEVLQQLQKTTVRPKPRTYTLHIEGMPEPDYYDADIDVTDRAFDLHVEFADELTAREALEKLTKAMGKAMGGNND